MSNSSQQKTQVSKETLLRIFDGISSHMEQTNEGFQEQLERLKVQDTDEFGIQLVNFVVDTTSSAAIAELASVTLKEYVKTHWSSSSMEFKPPEIGYKGKDMITQGLLVGLHTSNLKVRHEVADAISVIARSNWRKHWSHVFGTLVQYLNDKSEPARLGSMEALTQVTRYLTESQLEDVGPTILEKMAEILDNEEQPMSIRQQAIKIFTRMVTGIPAFQRPELAYQHLKVPIAMFCAKFLDTLRIANDATTETQMKILIVDTIRVVTEESPKCIATFLPKITPLIWDILMDCAEVHQGSALDIREEETPEDLADLVLAIFKFIGLIIGSTYDYPRNRNCRDLQHYQWFHLLETLPPEALHHLIMLVEITDQQIELWTLNSDKFIEEGEATDRPWNPSSLRGIAQETLLKILGRPERIAEDSSCRMNALFDIILKLIEEGNAMKNSSKSGERKNWWKLHEASIQVFGMMKAFILEKQSVGKLSFNVAAFLENVVLTDLGDSEIHPLLVGRCLYIGGVYALQMPKKLRYKFVEAIINGLKNQSPCTKILAAEAALLWFRAGLPGKNGSKNNKILKSYLPALFQELFHVGNQSMSFQVSMTVLQNFNTLIPLHDASTASALSSITALTLAAFDHFHDEYRIHEICKAVFCKLSRNSECIRQLILHLVPTSVGKLAAASSGECEDGKRQVDALEVLKHLVEHSPQPLSDLWIGSVFPASCRLILNSTKHAILLRGLQLIRAFLSVAAQQVLSYEDSNGKSGSQSVLQIAANIFSPQSPRDYFGPLFMLHAGEDLYKVAFDIVTLSVKNDASPENIKTLLEGVHSRINALKQFDCSDFKELQNLLMVYVFFFNTHFEAVFEFLTTAKEVGQRSALAFVISVGFCECLENFNHENRESVIMALSKIMEHSMEHQDSPLHNITFEEGYGHQVETSIPVLLKISRIMTGVISKHFNGW